MLSAKTIRYINQSIPFFTVWVIFGVTYVIIEYGILGNSPVYPSTNNAYSSENNFLYVFPACFLMGLLQAYFELIVFKKRFQRTALWLKIIVKSLFYIIVIICFLLIISVINAVDLYGNIFSENVRKDILSFVNAFAFWSVIIYTGFGAFMALLISEMSSHLGNGVFYNFLFGKYHNPSEEIRIFMFLDMKSSTSIAENLGHRPYFDLIKEYYDDMTNAIIKSKGEVYQYVGDEIVITWTKDNGLKNNNCIECFFEIEDIIGQKRHSYLQRFSIVPEFKAGFHIGDVTTGEIGILKKDIIYTGDVLNTTARIQAKCNAYNSKLIISKDLKQLLKPSSKLEYTNIGELLLRGKEKPIALYDVKRNR